MAGGLYALSNEIAVLSGGRLPEWTSLERSAVLTDRPSGSAGLALQSRVVTHLAMDLRRNVAGRTAYLRIANVDVTATYSVQINGVSCSYDAGAAGAADLQDVLDGIAAEIDASDPGGGADWVATAVDADNQSVQFRSGNEHGMVINGFSPTPGSATMTCEAEPLGADVEVWVQHVGLDSWRRGFTFENLRDNQAEVFPTAGLTRLALRATNLLGPPGEDSGVSLLPYRMSIGPARVESAA